MSLHCCSCPSEKWDWWNCASWGTSFPSPSWSWNMTATVYSFTAHENDRLCTLTLSSLESYDTLYIHVRRRRMCRHLGMLAMIHLQSYFVCTTQLSASNTLPLLSQFVHNACNKILRGNFVTVNRGGGVLYLFNNKNSFVLRRSALNRSCWRLKNHCLSLPKKKVQSNRQKSHSQMKPIKARL